MNEHRLNAPAVLAELRRAKRVARRKPYQASRLSRYRAELVALRLAGASFRELALWLRQQRVKVTHTTVMRYLARLPELLKEACDAKLP